jgi:hypothetical protein
LRILDGCHQLRDQRIGLGLQRHELPESIRSVCAHVLIESFRPESGLLRSVGSTHRRRIIERFDEDGLAAEAGTA